MKGETLVEPNGTVRKIIDYDDVNKMVYVHEWGGHYKWVHEPEYSTWTRNDTANMPKVYVPDIPAQMTEEQINSQSKTEEDAIREQITDEVDVCEQTTDGEEVGSRNAEPEIIAEKGEDKSKEKVKRKYTKKEK